MIPVNEPLLDGNEKKYLNECIETGWISSEGPFIKRFERSFAEMVHRKHAIAVTNGSMALEAAVAGLRLDPGTEVILPSFTIISCAAAIVRAGLVPVAVDVDATTLNIDVSLIEAAITLRTRAIMVVHVYGLPCDMDPILDIASRYKLKVIEDAAEMHGQTYRGKPCGSFGDISIFSFYPNKHITTGEGGMIVTDSDELAARICELRNLCFIPPRRFVHEELGYNMRMTNMQAALGVAQLERLPAIVERKRSMGRLYNELLQGMSDVELPPAITDYAESIYWVYGIVLKESIGFDAEEAMKRLDAAGIGTRPFFWPMHEQPVLRRMGFMAQAHCPVSERIARRGFYIPSGLALTEQQIRKVAYILRKVIHK
jgi:perosamine synthetase